MSESQIFVFVSLPFLALLLYSVVEVLRRPDLSAGRRVGWVAALLLIPVLGLFTYVVVRPPRRPPVSGDDASRAEAVVLAAEQRQRGELDDAGYRAALDVVAAS